MYCISCQKKNDSRFINFGKQYKCNEFWKKNQTFSLEKKNFIQLIECKYCGLIQLKKKINYKKIIPKFSWIKNKEEDSYHLNYINYLKKKKFLKKNINILGISNYDQNYIEQLSKLGFKNIKYLNLKKDLNIKTSDYNRQEVIQNFLNKDTASRFLERRKIKIDLIICSKLLEHSQNVKSVLEFFRLILTDSGYLIIDVPDSTKSLKTGNVSMVWEEHISYFTPETLSNSIIENKLSIINQKKFIYKQEDNLVSLIEKKNTKVKKIKKNNYFSKFKKKINSNYRKLNNVINIYKKKNYNFFIFGAGHNTIAFLNYYNLHKYFQFIIDDHPKKNNLKIPGTNILIKNFDYIKNYKKIIFFLGTNINLDKKIKTKLLSLKQVKVYSIFPESNFFYNK